MATEQVDPSVAVPGPTSAGRSTSDLSRHLPEAGASRRWRLVDRLVVVVFCLGLLVPSLLLAAGRRSAEIENRPLLTAPPMSLGGLFDPAWYAAVDRFLTDIDAVRPTAVRLRGEAYWRLGGTGNREVVRGLDSWLFTIQEIQAQCDLSATDVAGALDRANAAFTAAGQEFRFIVAPDKHVIYPEYLDPATPYGPSCTDDRRATMRAELARRSAFAIDGWAPLLAARAAQPKGPPLYYTQDSHWTKSGALVAIRGLIQSLGPDLWRDSDIVPGPPRRVQMELAQQIGLLRGETVAQPVVRPTVKVVCKALDLPVKTTGAQAVYLCTASGDRPLVPGRTVIVYDSFFGLNVAAVASFFQQSIWVHQTDLLNHAEIARMIGPIDRVVLERVERGLYFTRIDDLLRPLVRTAG